MKCTKKTERKPTTENKEKKNGIEPQGTQKTQRFFVDFIKKSQPPNPKPQNYYLSI